MYRGKTKRKFNNLTDPNWFLLIFLRRRLKIVSIPHFKQIAKFHLESSKQGHPNTPLYIFNNRSTQTKRSECEYKLAHKQSKKKTASEKLTWSTVSIPLNLSIQLF